MNSTAIILVIFSAFFHSLWNFLSKKSRNKIVFNCFIIFTGTILYFPIFLYLFFTNKIQIQPIVWPLVILSAIFHALYFYFLAQSYHYGDLSLTYPLARSSPIFVPFLAFILIKEKLSLLGMLGIIVILIGVYLLHLKTLRLRWHLIALKNVRKKATIFALLTALFSAFYSINDKISVQYIHPFIFIYLTHVVMNIFFLPIILSKQIYNKIKIEWNNNSKSILVSGFLIILSYLLTLFAFKIEKVSYIVSLRQISIIFGVIFGVFILKEEYGRIRLIASIVMFIGCFLVAIA